MDIVSSSGRLLAMLDLAGDEPPPLASLLSSWSEPQLESSELDSISSGLVGLLSGPLVNLAKRRLRLDIGWFLRCFVALE